MFQCKYCLETFSSRASLNWHHRHAPPAVCPSPQVVCPAPPPVRPEQQSQSQVVIVNYGVVNVVRGP